MSYRDHFATRLAETPQTEAIEGTVENNAGGFSFALDDWKRLEQFLILGAEGGTYYVGERKLTRDNAKAAERCLKEDGQRVIALVTEISHGGRAPKNDPALFVLAMCAGLGDEATRKAALSALPKVARTGTHLLHFAHFVEGFRGWGRGLRRAVADWFNEKPVQALALQAIKYRQRDGWALRDLLRLAHPKTDDVDRNAIYDWIVNSHKAGFCHNGGRFTSQLIDAYYAVRERADNPAVAARIIREARLPREAVPTELLNDFWVWSALLKDMPMTALVRNLGKMSSVGLVAPLSNGEAKVVEALEDVERIRKSRLHPLSLLVAQKVYAQGRGDRGSLSWQVSQRVVDALDGAFYKAFQTVQPTGKRILLALDVSGSMGWENIAGMPITPREASAALALVTAATEERYAITAFSHQLVPVNIGARSRLSDVVATLSQIRMGGTDCSLPMLYALENLLKVDAFVVYTDSETWAGRMHPVEALRKYRAKTGIDARLIVVGMTSNGFSIADPNDPGMLDVVGFDTATPAVIADFIRG